MTAQEHTYIHIYHTYIHVYIHTYVHIPRIHTCVHTYVHTYTCTKYDQIGTFGSGLAFTGILNMCMCWWTHRSTLVVI